MNLRTFLAIGLLSVALASGALVALADEAVSPARPRLITEKQYRCLIAHLADLSIGKRGNVIDLSICPPAVLLGSFPIPPGRDYLFLKAEDVACLKQVRSNKAAVERTDGTVALYLQPCGK